MIYRFKATLFSINNKTVTTVQTAPYQSKKLGKPGRYERRPNSITNLNKKNKTPTIQTHASIYYPPHIIHPRKHNSSRGCELQLSKSAISAKIAPPPTHKDQRRVTHTPLYREIFGFEAADSAWACVLPVAAYTL